MPAFDHRRYYVHQDVDDLQRTPGSELLVQAKPIPRSRPPHHGLPKLPPLYSYPKPSRHRPTDATSIGSSDWLTRSEPSERSAPVFKQSPLKQPSTARSLPSLPSRQRKEALKVKFVSASDLQDLVQFKDSSTKACSQRHSSRLPSLGDLKPAEKQSVYAWSHKPLIKGRHNVAQRVRQPSSQDVNREVNYAQLTALQSPRGVVNMSTHEGHLEGKRAGVAPVAVNTGKPHNKALSRDPYHQRDGLTEQLTEQDDLSDDELDSASALFPLEEDKLYRRERFKKKLLRNAIETLERYEGRPVDPLLSLSSIKLGKSAGLGAGVSSVSSRLQLDAIPEGENESREEQLSEDGASSYSSGSRGSSDRRPIRDRHRMNLVSSWRSKSPALAKPGLAMIPENEQGNVGSGTGGGAAGSRFEPHGAGPTSHSQEKMTKTGLNQTLGDTQNAIKQRTGYRGLMPSPSMGTKGLTPKRTQVFVHSPLPGTHGHKQESKAQTKIQQFRDQMTNRQKPKQIRFLKT